MRSAHPPMAEKPSATTTALQWVERLLEPSASEDMMIEAAQIFSPGHYSDVVDERIISHMCGYPLCSNPLGTQPRQKYHISLAQKKVFDLTQRKKYCSVECYRASNYYASQLSSLPPSARTAVVIKFLPHAGSMVEDLNTSIDNSNSSRSTLKTSDLFKKPPMKSPANDLGVVIKEVQVKETTSELSELRLTDETESGDTEQRDSVLLTHPKLSSVGRLLHAMSSWCSPETRCFVIDQVEQLKTHPEGEGVQQAGKEPSDSDKLSQQSVMKHSESSCDERASQGSKPCCDEEERKERKDVDTREDMESVKILPPVHSSGQSHLQRTIFVQQLKRNVSSIAVDLRLNADEVLPRILPLVSTFRFSRHTVMFKPAEWRVIILVLIHIVAPEWNTVLRPTSGVVKDWLRAVDATDTDLDLMLNTFTN